MYQEFWSQKSRRTGYLFYHTQTKDCDEKDVAVFFLCCIVENWRFRQPIFELRFIKMSSGFQTVGHFYCLIFPQNSELRQGSGPFSWEKSEFFRCFQNALRKWLLIKPENGCLSLLSPCTRRAPCSNKREKPLQAKLDYFFFYCSIKKPKTLENKGFRRYYLVRQKGFEPPAFPLGGGRSIQLSYWRVYQMKL